MNLTKNYRLKRFSDETFTAFFMQDKMKRMNSVTQPINLRLFKLQNIYYEHHGFYVRNSIWNLNIRCSDKQITRSFGDSVHCTGLHGFSIRKIQSALFTSIILLTRVKDIHIYNRCSSSLRSYRISLASLDIQRFNVFHFGLFKVASKFSVISMISP